MNVRVIPAIPKFAPTADSPIRKKRVAGYARVSTDLAEQQTSYEAQIDYYTKYINEKSEWEFVKVFTDEGITATNTKKRDGFNEMIKRALNGEIDLIITKSVSRFARNTVDTLTTVRMLKEKGVEVYFEKENIYTLDSKGELLITIMSSLAQEESRSISENVTWGQRKRFADGKVSLPYKQFLGYEKGENGYPKVVESEAKIVRKIYDLFYFKGKTPTYIATYLTEKKIPSPSGKEIWQSSTVESILTNEKYKGDALLQKTFTVDFLSKKKKVNEGEIQQYYLEGSHPAIIQPELFDLVQIEFEKRKGQKRSTAGIFASKLICGDCGHFYGNKVWHSNSKYRRTVWQCNSKFRNTEKCKTPHLDEEKLKGIFVDLFNSMIEEREEIIQTLTDIIKDLTDTTKLDAKIQKEEMESKKAAEKIREWVNENAHRAMNQMDYEMEYQKRADVYRKIQESIESMSNEKLLRQNKYKETVVVLNLLKENEKPITEFDEGLFHSLIDNVKVMSEKRLVFCFKDGTEIDRDI